MGLQNVKQEIIENANKESQELTNQAKEQAKKILDKAKAEIKQEKDQIKTELKDYEKKLNTIDIASSELELKKMLLDEKKKAIDKVFEEVTKQLQSLPSEKRKEHIQKLLDKAKNELEVSFVHCNKQDRNEIKDCEVILIDNLGGIIAENKSKEMRVDYCYETLLEGIKDKYLQDLGKILFG